MANRPIDLDTRQSLRDVFFTPNRYHLDDRFVIRDGKRHPVAVIVPGGGYGMVCSFIEGTPVARKLNELGISAFIVYYRTRKKARYPAPQEDLARAIREILAKADAYHLDVDNYSIWGSSAGGHLAASFGTEAMGYSRFDLPKPGALILSYPVISLRRELTHAGTHDNLLGKHATFAQERFASVDEQVAKSYPPTYIWCGDADTTVPPENTKRMASALEKADVPYQCEIFPGVDHGVGPATGTAAEGWIERAAAFWMQQRATPDR